LDTQIIYGDSNLQKTKYYYNNDGRTNKKEVKDKLENVIYSEKYIFDDAFENGRYAKISKTVVGDELNSPSIVTNIYFNKYGQTEKQERMITDNTSYIDTFAYDYLGNKTKEKSARAYDEIWKNANNVEYTYTVEYQYNYEGKVTKVINIKGDFTTTEYDALGRVRTVTDNKANKITSKYYTSYSYDNLGRVIKENVPLQKDSNGTMQYSIKKHYYDRNGNITKELVSNNKLGGALGFNQTEYEYNERNLLTKVTTYNSGAEVNYTQYYYDPVGNKVRMYTGLSESLTINDLNIAPTGLDPDYSETKYSYDQFNRLDSMTDTLGKTESYTYDINGNMTKKIDRNGNTIDMTYDVLNRMLTRSITTPSGVVGPKYTTSYTLTGAIKTTDDGVNSTTFFYDTLGRLKTESDSNKISKNYTYDAADNRKSMVVLQDEVEKENTTYTYDDMNRLKTVSEKGQLVATYSYDENGNRDTIEYNASKNYTKYQYNPGNKLVTLTNRKGGPSGTIISSYTYSYYLDGNQATKTEKIENAADTTTIYEYDGLGRLAKVIEPGSITTTYLYDDYNNRKTMTITGGTNPGTTEYLYDRNNRLLKETKISGNQTFITSFNYDNNGNQISKSTETIKPLATGNVEAFSLSLAGTSALDTVSFYEYDGFNQLIKATEGDKTITYSYDGNGLRTSKTVNSVVTKHVWDGDQIILELNGSGAVTNKYVRGINLIYAETGANRRYYLFNGHGDVVQLTGSDGSVTKIYEYDTFGNEKNIDATDTNVFRYCSEYFDKETGTIYLRARYYDAGIGRFTSEDSVWGNDSDSLSLNLYTYCLNNSVNLIDPSGHLSDEYMLRMADDSPVDISPLQDIKYLPDRVYVAWGRTNPETRIPILQLGAGFYQEYFRIELAYMEHKGIDVTKLSRSELDAIYEKVHFERVGMTMAGLDAVSAGFSIAAKQIAKMTVTKAVINTGDNFVYLSKNADGVTQYVGITNDIARRQAEHLASKGIQIEPLFTNLSRYDARAVEQALIEIHRLSKNGGTLINMINSISKNNPIYSEAIKRGYELLELIGYI
jgi:RHS repeat-associated protein